MEHAEKLVGSDLIDSGVLHPHHDRPHRPAADLDGAAAARPGGGRSSARSTSCRGGPVPSSCSRPCGPPGSRAHWCRRPIGCCSTPCCERLPEGSFAVSVGGDEVTQGKPHPEPYEKACAAARRRRAALRGAGGLRHRRPVRQRGRCRGGRHPERGGHPGGAAPRHRTDARRAGRPTGWRPSTYGPAVLSRRLAAGLKPAWRRGRPGSCWCWPAARPADADPQPNPSQSTPTAPPLTVLSTDAIRVADPAAITDPGSVVLSLNVFQRLMTAEPGQARPEAGCGEGLPVHRRHRLHLHAEPEPGLPQRPRADLQRREVQHPARACAWTSPARRPRCCPPCGGSRPRIR